MLRVRPATAADYPAFQRFWVELAIEQPLLDAAYFEAHVVPFAMFLEADNGDVAAYGLCYPFGARGDVRQIAVDPAWRRRGVGRQLMAAVADRLRSAGCRDWRLEVAAHNVGAIALYESVGMRRLHDLRDLRMTADQLDRFAGPRSARLRTSRVQPPADAALEAHFDLGTGQLDRWRTARPHAPIWACHDQGTPVGLVRYWPDFRPDRGLCFPFRATTADIAAHLLFSARVSGEVELCIVEPVVADALLAAGATERERSLQMGGAL